MIEVNQLNNKQEITNIENNKKKTLKETLKESHKNQTKISKNLKINIDENLQKNKEELNDDVIDDAPDTEKQFNENAKFRKPDIKKIKVIPNKEKINSDTMNLDNNLRKIYVDLNEINNNQDVNDIMENQKNLYNNNSIRTCQYTIITFLPLALFNQFKSAFNWFFLIYNIIAMIPALSDLDPLAEVTPFIVVLIFNLIKEAIEDYRKYKNDKKANEASVLIFKDKRFHREKCENIRVGNILKIYKEDLIPADVLIIKSSLKTGLAYMQTSNLDGENTLKPREALNITQTKINNRLQNLKNTFDCSNEHFFIEVINPNKNIYEIEGTVFFNQNKIHINIKNVLLRGSRLKNVDYVYGIVIYNGHDTKLMQNIEHSSLKLSTIDVQINYIVLIIFIIYLLFIIISAVIGINAREQKLPDYVNNNIKGEYLFYYDKSNPKHALEITRIISNNFLIYNTLIPVSIFIAYTFCKVLQTIYLQQFSPEYKKDVNDNIKCYSTGLMDELGLVKYIFSDKTGTLTKNEMVFKGCSINRELFDDSGTNNGSVATDTYIARDMFNVPAQSFFGSTFSKKCSGNDSTKGWTNQSKLTISKVCDSFNTSNLYKYLQTSGSVYQTYVGGVPFTSKTEPFEQFFINIIVNHDVLVEHNSKNEINFQGPSPDEITLVTAAYEFGFCFISREKGIITIEIIDQDQNGHKREKKFKILQKFDFTSERQCSSIVVEDLATKRIILYIKGSDRKIFNILDDYSKSNIYPKTKEHLDHFAKQGLRTLCFGLKYISRENYNIWENKYKEMKHKTLENKIYQKDLDKVVNYLESNITLLGVSALEDKLQDEVEKDIKKFIDAGINFWMITGDKMDTAESIGYSCGIFSEDTDVYKIRETNNVENVIKAMTEISNKINKIDAELNNITKLHHEKMIKENKIIDGKKLNRYRNRFNSVDYNPESKNNFDVIYFNNTKKSDKKEIDMLNEDSTSNKDIKKNIFNNKNRKNIKSNKRLSYMNKIELNDSSLNHKNDNSIDYKKIQLKGDLNKIGSAQKNSENDKIIFKYVAKNVDNVSNYNDYSLIQKNIKNVEESANSSEIFKNEENEEQNNYNTNFQLQKEDEVANNKEDKKRKDIPLEEKQFNDYFDFCQNELYKMAIKQSNRIKLFKIKYLYPIPVDTGYINKKITSKFSLILEGQTITTCMTEGKAAELFWDLIQRSRSLICCRSSPSQKSQIVEFVKKRTSSVTLGIGDGGNDVNMIRAASVGIGIFGKEGFQAAYNSDYAISQFKYLKGLLFKEGRITIKKNSYFLYHYFFKNFLFTIALFWFGIFSLYSGGNYYNDYYTMGYNSFLTVIPICITAILDEDFDHNFKDYSDKERQLLFTFLPNIFKEYRDSHPFNLIKFFTIFLISMIFSFICFSIPIFTFRYNFYGEGSMGYQYCYWDSSITTYLSIIAIHYFIITIDTLCFSSGIIIFYAIQFVVTFAFLFFVEKSEDSELYDTLGFMLKNLNIWLTIVITCSFCLVFFYILRRAEFFFGGFILNKIKQKQFDIFIEKFYQKKVEQMTRVVRNVAKFKRIYYNEQDNSQEDILNDQKMKKIVEEFKDKKNKYMNNNFKKNKSTLK